MSRRLCTLVSLFGLLLLWACEQQKPPAPKPSQAPSTHRRYFGRPPDGKLHVYFLDVDQGDATLIISPSGKTALIDAGPANASIHLVNRLPELLTDKLDLVVITHPALDHYGGLSAVMGAVGAHKLLEPQLPNTSSDYDALRGSLASTGVQVISVAPPSATGEPLRLSLGPDTTLTVLWPRAPTEPLLAGEQLHELNSIVLRLTYKNTSVLLAGDARAETERKLLERQAPLEATLLKVGAHGMFISSTAPFLKAVNPGAAIISTGASRPERAPARDVVSRLEERGAQVFRTDRDGEVHAVSDGQRFTLSAQRRTPNSPPSPLELMGHEPPPPPAPPTEPPPAGDAPTAPPTGQEEAAPAPGPQGSTRPAKEGEASPSKAALSSTSKPVVASASKPVETRARRPAPGADIDLENAAPPPSKTVKTPRLASAVGTTCCVASNKAKKLHEPSCKSVKKISEENRVTFGSKAEGVGKGYTLAQDCNP